MALSLGICFLLLLVVVAWLAGYWRVAAQQSGETALQIIDPVALRNLVRKEDDVFLRNSLPRRYYRIARKARTRALQQYLVWIARGCAEIQVLVRSDDGKSAETRALGRSLFATALQLRIASLGLWSSLWLQRLFPEFDLMPNTLVTGYDNLGYSVRAYLAARLSRVSPAGFHS